VTRAVGILDAHKELAAALTGKKVGEQGGSG
jgi:hypothetical protein